MSISQGQNRDRLSWTLGYELGQSATGRAFVAALAALATLGVAYGFWRHQQIAALLATAWVCMWGLRQSWNLLPFSRELRARWAAERELYKAHAACQYCNLFWVGFYVVALDLWQKGPREVFSLDAMTVPAIFMVIGATCFFVCRRLVARARNGIA